MDAIPYRNDIALEASRQGHARGPGAGGTVPSPKRAAPASG